jgi:murein DD-endopeptidase MepM/ murein hydrolase activator NlpD
MSTIYTVKSKDTLGAIARSNGTTVDELVQANGLRDSNKISPGQHLVVPTPRAALRTDVATNDNFWSSTRLRFTDAVDRAIANLKVRITNGHQELIATTDANGCLPAMSCARSGATLDIFVKRAAHKGGGEKKIGSYTPMAGEQAVRVQSGKQVEKTKMRRHEGNPYVPPKKMLRETTGTKLETATPAGNPLTCVKGCECPNPDNLMLGPNAEFREYVKTAGQRAGVVLQAVAAVMNAEAAKDKTGKWKADSKSPASSATGMTQFLDGSWIGEALRTGTHLNAKALQNGWLSKDAKGQLQFKKADGSFVTGPNLVCKLMVLVKPKRVSSDANLQKLLDLREQAEYAIIGAMDYAKGNLDALFAKGYDVAGLNDTEKARIMYLCHHLGIGDAVHFIQNTITEEDVLKQGKNGKKILAQNGAKKLLTAQIGVDKAGKYRADNGDSWVKGHREWLNRFVGNSIKPSVFACPGSVREDFESDEKDSPLTKVTNRLKK